MIPELDFLNHKQFDNFRPLNTQLFWQGTVQFGMILVELRSGKDLFPENILSVLEKYHWKFLWRILLSINPVENGPQYGRQLSDFYRPLLKVSDENQPMLSIDIIFSIHSVSSLDLSLFINWIITSPGNTLLLSSAGDDW